MYRPIDLYVFVMASMACPEPQRSNFVPAYEMSMSLRNSPMDYKEHEFASLLAVVTGYLEKKGESDHLNGFAVSYKIPHIPTELDLLKIGEDTVLNIELKSSLEEEKARRQLERHAYYLSFIGKKVMSLVYDAENDQWYRRHKGELEKTEWNDAIKCIASTGKPLDGDLDLLFKPSNYLVSPIENYSRFCEDRYFLSAQQEQIKNQVLGYLNDEGSGGLIIKGEAGTGKSLLLYDVAKTIARKTGRPAAIFHGAKLSNLHARFNERSKEIAILAPRMLEVADLGGYSFVGFDESHRMYPSQFESAMNRVNELEIPYLVMADPNQEMSLSEQKNDTYGIACKMVPAERVLELSKKFRTNETVAKFVNAFIYGRGPGPGPTDRVSIVFARDYEEAKMFVNRFVAKGYRYISISPSLYKTSVLDGLSPLGVPNTHDVIGLEFEKVVMIADYVCVAKNRLCDVGHPNPNLLPTRLLYQGLTRARDAIALVVPIDWSVFQKAVSLLSP